MQIVYPQLAQDGTIYEKGVNPFNITSSVIGDTDYLMEAKYDGSRYILQWDSLGNPHLSSRNNSVATGLPVVKTHLLDGIVYTKDEFLSGTILDGEVVVIPKGSSDLAKSKSQFVNEIMLSKEKSRVVELLEKKYDVFYVVYDILQIKGNNLRQTPYLTRTRVHLEFVRNIISGTPGFKNIVTSVSFPNTESSLISLLLSGYEGVVLKPVSSFYRENERVDWIKVKKLITEDAIVIGGVRGTGKYSNTLGALKLGQYVKKIGGLYEVAYEMNNIKVSSDFRQIEIDGEYYELEEVATISGMTDIQRHWYWKWVEENCINGDAILTAENLKIVEFYSQEKTHARYRHPRFIRERDDKEFYNCKF